MSVLGRVVIACYRPLPGKADALRTLMARHLPRLRAAGLVTDRASIIAEAADGTIIEVFEWRSAEAIAAAHAHPDVQAMWAEYAAVCEYVPLAAVPEAAKLFSEFAPMAP